MAEHYPFMAVSEAFWGKRVTVSPLLPIPPTFNEQIRRRVRHGLADVLAWLGEEVGPRPEDVTGAIDTPFGLLVSQEFHDALTAQPSPASPDTEGGRPPCPICADIGWCVHRKATAPSPDTAADGSKS